MRFDDRIATVLALPAADAAARAAKWRQLVDLLAQHRPDPYGDEEGEEGGSDELDAAYDFLVAARAHVPLATRRAVAEAFAGRRIAPDLVRFFAEDQAQVAAALLGGARLRAAEWIALLPSLSPTARSLLRHRRDLPDAVVQALASFGPTDFSLHGTVEPVGAADAAPAGAAAPGPEGEAQIRELVARIEAFRKQRETAGPARPQLLPDHVEEFRWETGADGTILWVEGAPRGPLVGQTVASIAERGQHGVDGQAAGAFEKRAPFRDARFSVAGSGPAAGDWRISGVPFFDAATGSFLGYRGSARRPRLDEVARHAEAAPAGLFGTELPPDSLRQLVHELRTPLNAIVGFAEMIDGQYMGPAGAAYRSRAGDILEQARRLLAAVDDLDTAARIETRRFTVDDSATDAVALLCRLHDSYERVAGQRGSRIAIEIRQGLPAARVDEGAAERMFARMLAATIGLAREGETIGAAMTLEAVGPERMLCLAIDRPQAIAGIDEAALLDPGYSPDGDWPGAPALGLGFALRLVRNLAEAAGGALEVGAERFALYLPIAQPQGEASGRRG